MSFIIVVEDEPHIQRLIKLILEKQQHQVHAFGTGEDALAYLAKAPVQPDLILLDILMPGMDGLSVLKNLKADPQLKSIPVVMLTALAQENVIVQGIKLGAKDYIRKPFNPTELTRRLGKHLGAA